MFSIDAMLPFPYYSLSLMEGFPSGQRGETVNLLRKLRRFESFSLHHKNSMAVYWQHLSFKSHTWFYFLQIAFRKQLVYHWRHFGFNRLPFGQRQTTLTYQFILSIGYQYITLIQFQLCPRHVWREVPRAFGRIMQLIRTRLSLNALNHTRDDAMVLQTCLQYRYKIPHQHSRIVHNTDLLNGIGLVFSHRIHLHTGTGGQNQQT